MSWTNLIVQSNKEDVDSISDFLIALGAISTSIENTNLNQNNEELIFDEPHNQSQQFWENNTVQALFENSIDIEIIKESKLAKYINSPETEFYKKGSIIFNLDKAKNCRSETDEVIIVEGYMDVVSLYSSGIKNVIANSGTALTERQIDIIWKFFSNPIICLDGDSSGQSAALRIAEKLLPLINEENKIYFSIMPEGKDPDDYIKKNGKDGLLNLLKDKQIIQSYIWNYHLSKIDQKNPFEVSKFEKEIKKLSYSIQDVTLKKYVLEDYLEEIKKLTPIQTSRQNFNYTKFNKKKDFQVLKETKILYQKRKDLSKTQIIEFSILFIILNYLDLAYKIINELSEIEFLSEKNESLKNTVISLLSDGDNKDAIHSKIDDEYKKLLEEFKYDHESISKLMSKSRSHISNTLRLLTLPEDVISMLEERSLTSGQARPLIGLANASAIAEEIVSKNYSARKVEYLVKSKKEAKCKKNYDANILNAKDKIEKALGLNVHISNKKNNSGKVTIAYESLEQFELISKLLTKN